MYKDDIFGTEVPDVLLEILENDQARERFLSLNDKTRKAIITRSRGMLSNEMRTYFEKLFLN